MAERLYTLYDDFSGGENHSATNDKLLENEVKALVNLDPAIVGGAKQRGGIEENNRTITGKRKDRIIEFEYLNGTTPVLKRLELCDGKLIDPDTPDAGNTYKILKSGLGKDLDYTVFNNKMYILSNDKFFTYDGTTCVDVTNGEAGSLINTIKKGRYITKHGDRFFISGIPSEPNALYYSERLDPTYFKDTTQGTINPIKALSNDADTITGLDTLHGALLVFKRRRVFAWFGTDPQTDVSFKELDTHTGTSAYRTLQRVNNYLFFLGSDNNVYALAGTYENTITTLPVSTKMSTKMSAIKYRTPYNENTPCAVMHDNKYILSAGTTTAAQNDTVFVLHIPVWESNKSECWTRYKGWNISDFIIGYDGELYSASSVDGITHKHVPDLLTDLGQPIIVEVEPRDFHCNAPLHNKKFRKLFVIGQQQEAEATNLLADITVDYDDTLSQVAVGLDKSLVWDEGAWDIARWDWADTVQHLIKVGKRGMRLGIKLVSTNAVNKVVLYGVGIEYKLKRPNKG